MICNIFSDLHILLYFIDLPFCLSFFFSTFSTSLESYHLCYRSKFVYFVSVCHAFEYQNWTKNKNWKKKNQKRNHLSASRDAGSEIIQHDEDDDDEEEEEENSIDMDVDSDQLNEPLVIVFVVVDCDQVAIVS